MKIASIFVMKHHLELIAVQFHQHIKRYLFIHFWLSQCLKQN